jgi:hypothetical protein
LDGCQASTEGACVSCEDRHGSGCTSCTSAGCSTWACMTAECLGCVDTHGVGCTQCTNSGNATCSQWDCTEVAGGQCTRTQYLVGCVQGGAYPSAGICRSCDADPTGGYGYGAGCTSCNEDQCLIRDCDTAEDSMCGGSEYLAGCSPSNKGSCDSCASRHDAGCAKCTIDSCAERNCAL